MVARSRPLTRRPKLRGDHPQESTTPLTEEALSSEVSGSLRSKRARISSISDPQRLKKRLKTDKNNVLQQLKIPLRSRRPQDTPKPKPVIQKPVTRTVSSPNRSNKSHSTSLENLPNKQVRHNNAPQTEKSNLNAQLNIIIPQQYDKRNLRSKDGGNRIKTELAMYFNNYEQMLSLDNAKPGAYLCIPYSPTC